MALTRLPSTSHEPLLWEYAGSKESTDLVAIDDRYGLYIDGEFRAPKSRKHFPTLNPATEEELASVAEAGEAEAPIVTLAPRRNGIEVRLA